MKKFLRSLSLVLTGLGMIPFIIGMLIGGLVMIISVCPLIPGIILFYFSNPKKEREKHIAEMIWDGVYEDDDSDSDDATIH